jgi:hypothetical protein
MSRPLEKENDTLIQSWRNLGGRNSKKGNNPAPAQAPAAANILLVCGRRLILFKQAHVDKGQQCNGERPMKVCAWHQLSCVSLARI